MRNHRPTKKTINRINNNKSRQSMVDEVNRLKSLGKAGEAIDLLKNEIALSNDERLIFELAEVYLSLYRYKEALEELLKIEDSSKVKQYFVYYRIALCYFYLEDYSKSFDYRVKTYEVDTKKSDGSLRYLLTSGRKAGRSNECLRYISEHPKIQDRKTQIQVLYVLQSLDLNEEALRYIRENNITPENSCDNQLFAKIYYYGLCDYETADYYISRYSDYNDPSFKLFKAKVKNKVGQFDESIELLKELVENNICYETAFYWLVSTYLRAGMVDEAQELLGTTYDIENNTINQATIDTYNKNYAHARELLEHVVKTNEEKKIEALFNLVFLSLREKKYEEVIQRAKNLLNSYNGKLSISEVNSLYRAIALAKASLGISVSGNGYYFSQINEYSKEKAIECTRLHYESDIGEGVFFPDINLEETFDMIQNEINNMEPSHIGIKSPNDTYLLDFENAGIIGDTVLNKMQVTTFANTKKIISFYPVSKLSFHHETEEEVKPKKETAKRLSQIEKFNQRYNKK